MIFAIGLDKTGTTSLTAAIKLLGINATHDVELARRLVAELKEANLDGLLPRFEAWSEAPLAREYEMLVRLFPEARFILTVRDKEAWIRSRIVHVLHNRCLGTGQSREIDTRAWSRKWDEHVEGVRNILGGRPNFLEIDVTVGNPWPALCTFLDRPIPNEPFPNRNTGRVKLSRLAEAFDSRPVGASSSGRGSTQSGLTA